MTATASATGEQRATFSRLLDEFEQPLKRLTGAYAEHPADRDDLFQEVAVALWGAIPRFRGEASERTWVYRIAHNTALTWKAKKRRRADRETDRERHGNPPDRDPHPEERALLAERRERLMCLIRALPSADKQLALLYLEDLSTSEIADISGLTESAVATRLSRVRARLAERIRQQEAKR